MQAFVRCVQQVMEIGEAWANIGAIHMQQKAWAKAHPALTEALKNKRESWRILENLMTVCIAMGCWREVVLHMNTLLDLRLKTKRTRGTFLSKVFPMSTIITQLYSFTASSKPVVLTKRKINED